MVWGTLLKFGKAAVKPIMDRAYRKPRFADAELTELRAQLSKLLETLKQSSVSAQLATRGSPNEQKPQDESAKAIEASTLVGQELACLLDTMALAHDIPPSLIEARRRYREVVADEANLDVVDREERVLRCEEIETATADLHREIEAYAFKRWGIGLKLKAGRIANRKLPE